MRALTIELLVTPKHEVVAAVMEPAITVFETPMLAIDFFMQGAMRVAREANIKLPIPTTPEPETDSL